MSGKDCRAERCVQPLALVRSDLISRLFQWQRVAISRAFMRARSADLLLLDEPTSHLDAHAQNDVLKTLDKICRDPRTGQKTKTVIIITHQLSLARRADKIAMFENGVSGIFNCRCRTL